MTNFYQLREFNILNNLGIAVDACAQFEYKGYQVSMSTIGRSKGACCTPICIFKDNHVVQDGFSTVQEAILHVDAIYENADEVKQTLLDFEKYSKQLYLTCSKFWEGAYKIKFTDDTVQVCTKLGGDITESLSEDMLAVVELAIDFFEQEKLSSGVPIVVINNIASIK
jgi:hypothetical protein